MSFLKTNCPSCAGPIEFRSGSSVVVICPFCKSAVARTDKDVEDLGKIADVMQSQSPLKMGLSGEWNGHRFELTGRAQISHSMGGFWDEWYATFSNGWVAWLAEAQGKFYLTFYKPLPEGVSLPDFEQIAPGQPLSGIGVDERLVVAEKGTASYVAAEGEIPYKLVPGEKSNYADLSGKDGVFATIDYSSSPPLLFYGKEVSLKDIGFADKRSAEREAREVSAEGMSCPNCGGALELKAPDKTERVTCPFCSSLLDVNQGNLRFLEALKKKQPPLKFVLDIGAKGSFKKFYDGAEFEVIGAMCRSVKIEGQRYYWNEYLLYNPKIGFRWLVHSDNHWNFAEPVNVADVEVASSFTGSRPSVKFNGHSFRIFQDTPATVEFVKGEFYWAVEVGERVKAADFISPPYMLSQEQTKNEVNWTLGTYITPKEVEKALGVSKLGRPWSVGPNQPFRGNSLIKYGFLLLAILVVIGIFMIPITGMGSTVLNQEFVLKPLPRANAGQVVMSQPFELEANKNVRVTASAPVSNSWAELNVDLIARKEGKTDEVEALLIPIEYYFGVSGGESWSEGGKTSDATISSVPGGQYEMRIEGSWKDWQRPMPVRVKVEQNVTRGVNFWVAFVVLALVPIWTLVRKLSFEGKRWSESMFGPSE
ncbi:MAG: DUF4178 domain-containing protein [Acidobacteria bacterium]|nr:MAG: DUF4178 domain-containing protein [Acidobacteriota bacterium]REJ98332.1 MAG: DUF4178 domain-containing protein [Acidobacteriota bacterium]REK17076.1 MAG: DUF4178 domain-containing protein [Acidobacteriota bacterium]REK42986.1 MAG: DUF4178 domain-containing protein [Acidobacteriota bacterium]